MVDISTVQIINYQVVNMQKTLKIMELLLNPLLVIIKITG